MNTKIPTPDGLTKKILIAMVVGVVVGVIFNLMGNPEWSKTYLTGGLFYIGSKAFVASLKLLVVPLVFVSIVCGTTSLEDIAQLGKVGTKTLGLYLATTAIAITFGLIVAIIVQPGAGIDLAASSNFQAKEAPPLVETIINIFPTNPFRSFVEAEMLQIILFSGLLGLALTLSGDAGKRLIGIFNDANEVILRMVMMIMAIAPIGVFCLIARVFAEQGLDVIFPLAKYFFVIIFVLLLHVGVTYFGLLKFVAKVSPVQFLKNFKDVPIFAFSTASSGATLPITLETVEHKLGVKNSIASFTIPLGATINMDGTAIMQGVATIFISQAYGVDIGVSGLLAVIVTATLASIGTAAVPGVGLITLAMVLRQVNLPVEGIGIIIGVDRLLDMARTAVNVTGDAAVSLTVAKSEGEWSQKIFDEDSWSEKAE